MRYLISDMFRLFQEAQSLEKEDRAFRRYLSARCEYYISNDVMREVEGFGDLFKVEQPLREKMIKDAKRASFGR